MNILNKNKTFYVWFTSYLAVFIIPLFFSLFNYFYSIEIIKYESLFHKKTTQNQMKDLVDLKINEIDKLTDQIIWDRQLRLYLKLGESKLKYKEIIEKKIKELRFLNKYIDQIYIINEKKGLSPEDRIIPDNFQSTGIDLKELSKYKEKPFAFNDINKNVKGTELYFIKKFFMMDEGKSDYYVLIFINPLLLNESIMQIEWIENGACFVLDNEGTVLSSVVNIEIDDYFKAHAEEFLNENKNIEEYLEFKKDKHIISMVKSDVIDWYYAIILPESIYYGKMKKFQTFVFILLFLCMILGIFISFFFTRKNYFPILRLVDLFSDKKTKTNYQDYINEFELLEMEIKSVISENTSILDAFSKNRIGLKRLFLRRLIMGEKPEQTIVSNQGNSFGVEFTNKYFTVLIIESSNKDSINIYKLKEELNNNSESLEKEFHGYYLSYSGMNVIILNLQGNDPLEFMSQLKAITGFIKRISGVTFNITSGNIYSSIESISSSYKEALQVLDYQILFNRKKLFLFSDMQNLKKNCKYQYLSNLEDEYKIYNLLTASKYNEAKKQIFYCIDLIEEHYMDIDILKIRLAGFKNLIIESLNIILRDEREILNENVLELIETKSFFQFRNTVNNIVLKLKKISPEKNRSDIVNSVKKYIEEHFSDRNISATDIAGEFGITTQHLSKIFNENNEVGLLQYINICRVEEAKNILLNEPDINVKETSQIVGYFNEITFNRNFRNITGLSPGKFRETKLKGKIKPSESC
ncbi:MAG: hypothetical protein B6241_04780 [Spirochaetaceae bacterium 4572_59]|nr:MAG: hypothetical protein B6241_04780 [Spirochaetaceae bacterium 4572_59]